MLVAVLPATQTLAQIHHHYLLLEVFPFDRAQINAAIAGTRDSDPIRVLAHEMHHWFDLVGTLWGQQYLDRVFEAFDAVCVRAPGTIDHYPSLLRLFDADRAILFPSYYKVVDRSAPVRSGPGEWSMELSTGAQVRPDGAPDERNPYLFVRFKDSRKLIARQPITVGALLELRALDAEQMAYLETRLLRPVDERAVEDAFYERSLLRTLYHPELTTYSAAAHLLANATHSSDVISTLRMGSYLASIALNLTPALFQLIKTPPELSAIRDARTQGFKNRAEHGWAFAALSYSLRQLAKQGAPNSFDALLRLIGLPDESTILTKAEQQMSPRRPPLVRHPELVRIRSLLRAAGVEILKARQVNEARFSHSSWSSLPAPVVVPRDCNVMPIGIPTMTMQDCEFLYGVEQMLRDETRQALRAARGLDFGFHDYTY